MKKIRKDDLFFIYYEQWIKVYKEGAVREMTMAKYRMTLKWVKELAPTLKVYELNRTTYQ